MNGKQVATTTDDPSKKPLFTEQHENELINVIRDFLFLYMPCLYINSIHLCLLVTLQIIEAAKADGMPKLVSEAKSNW